MIRPTEIDKNGKKADFVCDAHSGTVENLNLKTKTRRANAHIGDPVTQDSQDTISIDGSVLTPPCDCVTSFPAWDPGNKNGFALGQAKTKDD